MLALCCSNCANGTRQMPRLTTNSATTWINIDFGFSFLFSVPILCSIPDFVRACGLLQWKSIYDSHIILICNRRAAIAHNLCFLASILGQARKVNRRNLNSIIIRLTYDSHTHIRPRCDCVGLSSSFSLSLSL